MKPMTDSLKTKIVKYIKNGMDISELIEGVDIRGQDLSKARIKRIKRHYEDVTDVNFSNTTFGEIGATNYLTGCNISRCNFKGTIILGDFCFKRVKAHNCNFAQAQLVGVTYNHGDFTGSSFCDAVITMGGRVGHSAKIPKDQILVKWGITLVD